MLQLIQSRFSRKQNLKKITVHIPFHRETCGASNGIQEIEFSSRHEGFRGYIPLMVSGVLLNVMTSVASQINIWKVLFKTHFNRAQVALEFYIFNSSRWCFHLTQIPRFHELLTVSARMKYRCIRYCTLRKRRPFMKLFPETVHHKVL